MFRVTEIGLSYATENRVLEQLSWLVESADFLQAPYLRIDSNYFYFFKVNFTFEEKRCEGWLITLLSLTETSVLIASSRFVWPKVGFLSLSF